MTLPSTKGVRMPAEGGGQQTGEDWNFEKD